MTPGTPPREPIVFQTDAPPLTVPPWFAAELASIGVELEAGETDRLGRFLSVLLEANKSLNLTAITDHDGMWRKHVIDSLTLIQVLADLPAGALVADVGSGGGVPGLPLAICLPSLKFTLIETTGKKADFLRAAAGALGLANITVINQRAESLAQDHRNPIGREAYDAVIARALGPLNVAAELTVPLARPGGLIALVKGERADVELAEAKAALGVLGARHAGTIQTPTGRIVVLEKATRTPRTYPRPAGEPKRKPLT